MSNLGHYFFLGMNFIKKLFLKTKSSPFEKVKSFNNKLSQKQPNVLKIKVQKAEHVNIVKSQFTKDKKTYNSVLIHNLKIIKNLIINFRFKDILRYLKQTIGKSFLQKFTFLFVKLVVIFTLVSFLYLSILDTNYLVQDWAFKYTQDTFLDQEKIEKIVNKFHEERLFGILPSNEYWFANEKNLTYLAKTAVPQVKSIKILSRTFPNKLTLELDLAETISTLVLDINNTKQFWRMDKYGNTFTQDYSGKYINLVYIDTPVIFEDSNKQLSDLDIFKDNSKQLDKIYFTIFIRQLLSSLNYTPSSIRLSSINPADGVVSVYLGVNTFLRFDIYKFDKKNVEDRVREVFNSRTLADKLKSEEINYIDLSIPKKIYVCYKIYVCNIK